MHGHDRRAPCGAAVVGIDAAGAPSRQFQTWLATLPWESRLPVYARARLSAIFATLAPAGARLPSAGVPFARGLA